MWSAVCKPIIYDSKNIHSDCPRSAHSLWSWLALQQTADVSKIPSGRWRQQWVLECPARRLLSKMSHQPPQTQKEKQAPPSLICNRTGHQEHQIRVSDLNRQSGFHGRCRVASFETTRQTRISSRDLLDMISECNNNCKSENEQTQTSTSVWIGIALKSRTQDLAIWRTALTGNANIMSLSGPPGTSCRHEKGIINRESLTMELPIWNHLKSYCRPFHRMPDRYWKRQTPYLTRKPAKCFCFVSLT